MLSSRLARSRLASTPTYPHLGLLTHHRHSPLLYQDEIPFDNVCIYPTIWPLTIASPPPFGKIAYIVQQSDAILFYYTLSACMKQGQKQTTSSLAARRMRWKLKTPRAPTGKISTRDRTEAHSLSDLTYPYPSSSIDSTIRRTNQRWIMDSS